MKRILSVVGVGSICQLVMWSTFYATNEPFIRGGAMGAFVGFNWAVTLVLCVATFVLHKATDDRD